MVFIKKGEKSTEPLLKRLGQVCRFGRYWYEYILSGYIGVYFRVISDGPGITVELDCEYRHKTEFILLHQRIYDDTEFSAST